MLRIHLSGHMSMEGDDVLLRPRDFPGQQGRAAFAFLVTHRDSPVPRSDLATALWGAEPPQSRDPAISAIVSKLRSLLVRAGVDGTHALRAADGCYELRLPRGTWIDHEVALDSVHEAEAALRAGDPGRAYGPSAVAHHIARRPFLPGQDGHWFDQKRELLEGILVRALECRAEVYLWNREHSLAVEAAREMVRIRPFRETGYRVLMRAHTASGNTAEALRVYERCRMLIAEELGVPPSPETRALHAQVLQSL
jgi:SARP family transcriptional regulator, regulator of embCAB operon